jgi:type I restriction enzyme S subunit
MMRTLRFHELVEVSPSVKLEKSKEYPFVDMAAVEPGRRYVRAERKRAFTGGGTRFLPGDTLFARITPCLENGKIAQYQGVGSQPAFGSTEFFVFRARPTLADPGYVYYLATSDIVRKPAEKSMSGASGRQRADIKSIAELDVPAPPLPVQRKIAAILSAYDDLIENNRRRIEILEEMAQALYREWFVEFRFPGHEAVRMVDSPLGEIPEGWEITTLGEVCDITMGSSPKSQYYNENGDGLPFHQGVSSYGDLFPTHTRYCTKLMRLAEAGDILFSVRAPVGRMNVADRRLVIGRGLASIRSKTGYQMFCLYQLKDRFREEDSMGGGTIFKAVTKQDMNTIPFIWPSDGCRDAFENAVHPMFEQMANLTRRNALLRQTRDLLLPRLISGELDVSELYIDVGEEGA